jgi:TFIIF-interacting CTD phosphatase-like protein
MWSCLSHYVRTWCLPPRQGKFFQHRLYRTSCRKARGGMYLKDLDQVTALEQSGCRCVPRDGAHAGAAETCCSVLHTRGEPLERMVLVDNSPVSFICQPRNGILVSSWYDDGGDNALSSVLQLIRHLDRCDDVRPTLSALFGLEPVLKEYQEASAAIPDCNHHVCQSLIDRRQVHSHTLCC